MRNSPTLFFTLSALLVGCTPTSLPPESPLRLHATIQDLMAAEVDPAADFLWDSVGSTISAAGIEDRQPKTEAEWTAVRHQAITLVEAGNLLLLPGRRVAAQGRATEDATTPGIETPAAIQRKIDADPATFVALAHGLQDAGLSALDAIERKNPDALVTAGGAIDAACEACHLVYWYPNSPRPGAKRAAP